MTMQFSGAVQQPTFGLNFGKVKPIKTTFMSQTPETPASSLSLDNSMGAWGKSTDSLSNVMGAGGPNDLDAPTSLNTAAPKMGGDWMDGIGTGLKVAQVGLGVYSALEQAKMNNFMRGYYGDQMNMQRADFANAAKSTNEQMAQRQQNKLSAQGFSFNSAENKAGTEDYMKQWGVKETF